MQFDVNSSTFTDYALGPNLPSMATYDPFDDSEANPGPLELGRRMKSVERPEHPVCKFLVEASTVISQIIYGLSVLYRRPKLDACLPSFGRVLPCIFHKI